LWLGACTFLCLHTSRLKQFSQKVFTNSLHKQFSQTVYTKSIYKQFTQTVYTKCLLQHITLPSAYRKY